MENRTNLIMYHDEWTEGVCAYTQYSPTIYPYILVPDVLSHLCHVYCARSKRCLNQLSFADWSGYHIGSLEFHLPCLD